MAEFVGRIEYMGNLGQGPGNCQSCGNFRQHELIILLSTPHGTLRLCNDCWLELIEAGRLAAERAEQAPPRPPIVRTWSQRTRPAQEQVVTVESPEAPALTGAVEYHLIGQTAPGGPYTLPGGTPAPAQPITRPVVAPAAPAPAPRPGEVLPPPFLRSRKGYCWCGVKHIKLAWLSCERGHQLDPYYQGDSCPQCGVGLVVHQAMGCEEHGVPEENIK